MKLLAFLPPTERNKYLINRRVINLTDKLTSINAQYTKINQEHPNEFSSIENYRAYLEGEIELLKEKTLKEYPDYKFPAVNKLPNIYFKVPIPEEEHPEYNFVGMLIGPKGKTQKDIEQKTGAKILIVGTSIHEEFGMKHSSVQFRSDEPLHLKITGPCRQNIRDAYELIKPLISPK